MPAADSRRPAPALGAEIRPARSPPPNVCRQPMKNFPHAAVLVPGLAFSLLGVMAWRVGRTLRSLPRLEPLPGAHATAWEPEASLSVIIPACNEEGVIGAAVAAVLDSTASDRLEVIVVDGGSTDGTLRVAESIAARDRRVRVLRAPPRPAGDVVIGKSWACWQGAGVAKGRHLCFIDADFVLRPGALAACVKRLESERAALLALMPRKDLRLACEWVVEPPLAILHFLSPWMTETPRPEKPRAFTPGWFLLFDRAMYDRIGGHWGVRRSVLEDLALGGAVKAAGGRVLLALAPDAARLHLYDSWSEMCEGYTKNFFCGAGHRLDVALASAVVIPLAFAGPWLGLLSALPPWSGSLRRRALAAAFGLGGLGLQWLMRSWLRAAVGMPLRRFWTMPLGGLALAWFDVASVVLHLRGRVTWKGIRIPSHRGSL